MWSGLQSMRIHDRREAKPGCPSIHNGLSSEITTADSMLSSFLDGLTQALASTYPRWRSPEAGSGARIVPERFCTLIDEWWSRPRNSIKNDNGKSHSWF